MGEGFVKSGPFLDAGCIVYSISIFYFTFCLFGGVRMHPTHPPAYGPATLRHLCGRNVKYLPVRIVSLTGQVSARTPVHCQSQTDIARTLSPPTNWHFYLGCMHRRRSRGGGTGTGSRQTTVHQPDRLSPTLLVTVCRCMSGVHYYRIDDATRPLQTHNSALAGVKVGRH